MRVSFKILTTGRPWTQLEGQVFGSTVTPACAVGIAESSSRACSSAQGAEAAAVALGLDPGYLLPARLSMASPPGRRKSSTARRHRTGPATCINPHSVAKNE